MIVNNVFYYYYYFNSECLLLDQRGNNIWNIVVLCYLQHTLISFIYYYKMDTFDSGVAFESKGSVY